MRIKPDVHIKYPWFLSVGNDCWIGEGVWIGAKATVCPGVTCRSHSVLAVGSIVTKELETYGVYQGNPAIYTKKESSVMVDSDSAAEMISVQRVALRGRKANVKYLMFNV